MRMRPWRTRENEPEAKALGARIAAWASQVESDLWDGTTYAISWPEMPDGIADRDADCWEALLVAADVAGGRWPLTIRVAAVAAVAGSREEGDSVGKQILADIKVVFDSRLNTSFLAANKQALKTPMLINTLTRMEESLWTNFHRDNSPLKATKMAQILRPYGIRSSNIRWEDGTNSKGYYRKDFEDAWLRYLTPTDPQPTTVNGHQVLSDVASTTKVPVV